jgi:exosome complex component RRP43
MAKMFHLQELGPPKAEEPENGFLIINAELPPLCSSQFRPGPPSEKAQVLTAFLNDIASRSGIIDLKSLCIEPDKLVWTIYCDIICLNYDGATEDACFASLVGALLNSNSCLYLVAQCGAFCRLPFTVVNSVTATLPKVEYNTDTGTLTVDVKTKTSVNVLCKPIATSFAIVDEDTILVDPCGEEESLSVGSFVVVVADDKLCSVHKPGELLCMYCGTSLPILSYLTRKRC